MTSKRTTVALIGVVTAVAMALAVAPALMTTPASAKISSADTGCSNNGGNSPGGQQPTCTGGGLTQETENQNPAGSAPPGQNK